jgi:hypothetical protein
MWRSEERLKYWLENARQSEKTGLKSSPVKRLLPKLRFGQNAGKVKGEALVLDANAISIDPALGAPVSVKDGLDVFGEWTDITLKAISGVDSPNGRIGHIELLGDSRALELQIPQNRGARVRKTNLKMAAICGSFLSGSRAVGVHDLTHLFNHLPQLEDGSRFLVGDPAIRILTTQISELPHARTGIRIEDLQDSEREGFLHEARMLKNIRQDCAELLAVFRHVPIEVISRLRFIADKKKILYSISNGTRPTQTRIHDMAAILDTTSGEIHMVPHRAQFRLVSLN